MIDLAYLINLTAGIFLVLSALVWAIVPFRKPRWLSGLFFASMLLLGLEAIAAGFAAVSHDPESSLVLAWCARLLGLLWWAALAGATIRLCSALQSGRSFAGENARRGLGALLALGCFLVMYRAGAWASSWGKGMVPATSALDPQLVALPLFLLGALLYSGMGWRLLFERMGGAARTIAALGWFGLLSLCGVLASPLVLSAGGDLVLPLISAALSIQLVRVTHGWEGEDGAVPSGWNKRHACAFLWTRFPLRDRLFASMALTSLAPVAVIGATRLLPGVSDFEIAINISLAAALTSPLFTQLRECWKNAPKADRTPTEE